MENYRSVEELTAEEMEELKESYFSELVDSGEIEDVMPDITHPSEIPDDIIVDHYSDTYFAKDDFWCNQ